MGDRLLSVDGIPLHGASLAAALATLRQCSHEALFQVEYDVAIPGEPGACGLGLDRRRPKGGGADRGHRSSPLQWPDDLGQSPSFSGPLWAKRTVYQALFGATGILPRTSQRSPFLWSWFWWGEVGSNQNDSESDVSKCWKKSEGERWERLGGTFQFEAT